MNTSKLIFKIKSDMRLLPASSQAFEKLRSLLNWIRSEETSSTGRDTKLFKHTKVASSKIQSSHSSKDKHYERVERI